MVVWHSTNRPDLYYIGDDLDPVEIYARDFHKVDFPELELYATIFKIHGYISLDSEYDGKVCRPVVPW